ncbi:Xylose-responsive transcription regulator, ROK family [Pseudonocardia sp. Ae168_Ps1]|uniref:ROK family protein n=1 Tax=unclassified Pseudonocardia TaxID=2619320 RepID=UPI0001FFE4DD|nr:MULTISPECIES: ROK family protein [unclassified Pseudonocardia]ALE73940.1 ROK family transcriptional regulator [Pseudonocardia sp. EC080625-04]ALL77340.1 ROK family transcriptional regulator [Pseudonocardia sp. EC080610-09]ALL80256.1 ROK family transcriptional regulator [Pseudonocardia sp. EC080619-01]OLL71004.1 Xylose-responsive transcription regulator, ROK family [Pseudonocardia sp. Ae168_Ps1]OLL77446.1 Xylose-responsive transcription regulator, ROK family [Pseudonocardia sp. Ae150A_Ps1]
MSTPTGTRPDDARRHNRTALLRRLHVDGPCTRATLAGELGLNRSTIKSVVDGLAGAGVVSEAVPARRSGAGRPSLLVLPDPQAAVVLAVDVRVDQVALAMVGIGGQILGRHSWNLHRTTRLPGEVITHLAESAELLRDELGVRERGAGVSVPGVVRRADGFVHEAPNLGWRDVGLGSRLSSVLGTPVQVANDAELGALAEHVRGVGRDVADMVYLSADVGVGGGVVSGGRPLRGTGGYVGELGHLLVRPDGRECFCGSRGCWETEVGEPALCRALGLPEDTARGVLVAELRALAAVPGRAEHLLGGYAGWMAAGLVTIVNMLAPELVVLGDLFGALPAPVVDRVRAEVERRSLVSRAVGGTRIAVSPLGRDGALVGAAELAFEPVLEVV